MIGVKVHNRRMHGVYQAVDLFPERRTSDHTQSSPIIADQEWLMGGRPGSSAVSNAQSQFNRARAKLTENHESSETKFRSQHSCEQKRKHNKERSARAGGDGN
jgi:hypothetical protein